MSRTATGIDLGASAIRAVRLTLREGQLEVSAAASRELPAYGKSPPGPAPEGARPPVEPGAAPAGDGAADADAGRERELRADLASLLRRGGLRSGRAVLGLGGNTALIRYLQIPPVPPWKIEMMMKYEVQEQSASGEPSAFDYRILDLPDVGGQLTVMLAQVQERKLLARTELARYAGLGRPDVDLATLGLFNAYLHGHGAEAERTVLLLDIGAETLDLVVARGSALCFARSVPGGGSRFTAAAAEALKLTFEEAESLKRDRGRILPPEGVRGTPAPAGAPGPEPGPAAEPEPAVPEVVKRLSAALEREAIALGGLIDSSLMYCRAQTKQAKLRPDQVLISGGGSMLPGLAEALARRMRMRVDRLEPFRKISLGALPPEDVAELSAQAPRYAAAVGLAASRLDPGAVRFSMVPESVKARRRFLEGGIYMWYAAALILVVAGILTWVPWRNGRIVAAEKDKRESLLEDAEKADQEFGQVYALAMQRRTEVGALEERVYSGRDIVRVLSHLKKHTWGPGGKFRDVVILEAGNMPPPLVKDVPEAERGLTFQKARRVFVRGIVTVPAGTGARHDAETRAKDLIDEYQKELERPGADNDIIETVKRSYTQPIAELIDGARRARLQFVLEMVLLPTTGRPAKPAGAAKAGGKP